MRGGYAEHFHFAAKCRWLRKGRGRARKVILPFTMLAKNFAATFPRCPQRSDHGLMKNIQTAATSSPAHSPAHARATQTGGQTGTQPCAGLSGRKRTSDLQRLLAAWPEEIADISIAGRRRTVRRLEKALRQERARGRAGHWAYDVARHQQLAHHLSLEQSALRSQDTLDRQRHTFKAAAQTQKART